MSEIRQVEADIRTQAEDKSLSLRQLLATRYHDLLLASDRISHMSQLASVKVQDSLETVSKRSTGLREQLLQRRAVTPNVEPMEDRKHIGQVADMLKHVVDSPETLYAHLEAAEVFEAALCFAQAEKHYNKLIQLKPIQDVATRFVNLRWKAVETFRARILEEAYQTLNSQHHSPVVYVRVFSAILLLSTGPVLPKIEHMLAARTVWVQDHPSNTNAGISRIVSVANVIKDCLHCLAQMFYRESGVENLLAKDHSDCAHLVVKSRDEGQIRQGAGEWIEQVREWLSEHGHLLLEDSTSSRSLSDALKEVDGVLLTDEFSKDCADVLGQQVSFIFDLFNPLFSARASSVARSSVEQAVVEAIRAIDVASEGLSVGKHAGKQVWMSVSDASLIWQQNLSSNVLGGTEDPDISTLLEAQPPITDVMGALETCLQDCLTDVGELTHRVGSVSSAFASAVREFVPRILKALRERLEALPTEVEENTDVQSVSRKRQEILEQTLFIAKVATALRNSRAVHEALGADEKADDGWENLCMDARELAKGSYDGWAKRVCKALGEGLERSLEKERGADVQMGWITAEEGGVGYPGTMSTAAMRLVLGACEEMNRAGGLGLPVEAVDAVRRELVVTTVSAYREAIDGLKERDGMTNDDAVMQLLFDVKVMRRVLGDDGNDDELRKVEKRLHDLVDPVDMTAVKKELSSGVERFLGRACVLVGLLSKERIHGVGIGGTSGGGNANVMELAETVSRLTFLPAPMPTTWGGSGGVAGVSAKAALGALRSEVRGGRAARKKEEDAWSSAGGVASKVSESVGRIGRGFFESWTRKVG